MSKMTKEINIINVFSESVTINPVPYEIALKVIELREKTALLVDQIGKLFVKLYDAGELIPTRNEEVQRLLAEDDKLNQEENSLREKFNYWYCGLDNLYQEDKEKIINKYPRLKTK